MIFKRIKPNDHACPLEMLFEFLFHFGADEMCFLQTDIRIFEHHMEADKNFPARLVGF